MTPVPATPPHPRPADWAGVLTLGIVWGATFLVIEIALRGITPFWLASARIGFAAVLMTLIWQMRGGALFHTRTGRQTWTNMVVIGALSSALPFMLLSWGQQSVTSGFAGVSMAAVALMVLPLAHVLTHDERMTWRRIIGVVVGFAGVVLLIGAQAFESTGATTELWGRIACLSAAACYALSSVMMRRLPPVDPVGLATVLLIIGAAIVIPAAWIVEGPPPLPDRTTLIALAVLGLLPTAAANLLRVVVIRSAGPTFVSLTNYQVPVWSVLLGAAILNEPLPPSLLMALVLILAGLAISQWGALKRVFGAGATPI